MPASSLAIPMTQKQLQKQIQEPPSCHEHHDCKVKHTLIELKKIMTGQVEKKWADIAAKENEIIVKKWHDYTSKYGLGFLLTNNTVGVIFNDGSRIL